MPSAPAWQVLPPGLVDRLVGSPEPAARWVALTSLRRRPTSDQDVAAAHGEVLADPLTQDLLARLVPWEVENPVSGHQHPHFAPNLLALLADLGVTDRDDERIAACHTAMLGHQSPDGRFLALGRARGADAPVWAALPCDSHAILETLLRAGHGRDPRVRRAVERLAADLTETAQGQAWRCRPDPQLGFRGPGRVGDACPQVTVEALRAISWLPGPEQPPGTTTVAVRTLLGIWRRRGLEQPYMFGHGRRFKEVKWPPTWYSALAVLDAVGRFPETWNGPDADPADRQSVAELAACVAAYNIGPGGVVVPRSIYTGFGRHTFGQKRTSSDLAAALVAAVLVRVEPLAEAIRAVRVETLESSKGGSGSPRPPR